MCYRSAVFLMSTRMVRLSMLNPKAGCAFMGIKDFVLGIGMIKGKTGKNKEVHQKKFLIIGGIYRA